jgi:hypothetical protein
MGIDKGAREALEQAAKDCERASERAIKVAKEIKAKREKAVTS